MTSGPGGAGQDLSEEEQRKLRRENGGQAFNLNNLGDPGERFETDQFITTHLCSPQRT